MLDQLLDAGSVALFQTHQPQRSEAPDQRIQVTFLGDYHVVYHA